jgi:hypothetical protein
MVANWHSSERGSMSTATVPSAYALLSVMRTNPSGRGSGVAARSADAARSAAESRGPPGPVRPLASPREE